jgi:cephalosporin hydroxylase
MASFMEDCLDLPLRQVLQIMQDRIATQTSYFGVQTLKCPIDFWVYQEIMCETQPDVIVEIGNRFGGSALAFAHVCERLGKGRFIGIDISHRDLEARVRAHPCITLIEGDACESFEAVIRLIGPDERVFIIEDSAHTFAHTLRVLQLYSELVKPGDYFIVEDSICHHGISAGSHRVFTEPDPGPYAAIEAFVSENPDFVIDRSRESFLITWNPKGYLKRATRL